MTAPATLRDVRLLDLTCIDEPNGTLVVAEAARQVPFAITRLFAVTAVAAGEKRGHHAHKRLNQLLICLSGSVEVRLDDGTDGTVVVLDHPCRALHIPPGIWAEQIYAGPQTVLAVLCDLPYEEADYLRDRDAFLAYRQSCQEA